ncbi:MAG: hypothetical protein IT498_05800 [Rubrivivax sp.]|nr:hypothetical protein [Rubrivivax sp.]HNT84268.1 hypothetical protein [Ottowia sp.]HOZ93350.1 hypothetical protein [Ottowia sp.]
MSALEPGALQREHQLLLRHLGRVQQRVSEQMLAQAQRCAALEAELMQWRARWIVATTRRLWGLGGFDQPPAPARAVPADRSAWASATEVLCQTGCAGHAHPWRDEQGRCALTASDCTRVPPVAQDASAGAVARVFSRP